MTDSESSNANTPPNANCTLPVPHRPRGTNSIFSLFEDDTDAANPAQIDPQLSHFGFPAGSANAPGLGISSLVGTSSDFDLDDQSDMQQDDFNPSSSSFNTPGLTSSSFLRTRPLMQDMTAFGERVRLALLPNPTPETLGAFNEFCLPHTLEERMVALYASNLYTQQLLIAMITSDASTINYRIPQELKVSVEPFINCLANSLSAFHRRPSTHIA